MTEIEDVARWCMDATAAAGQTGIITAHGAREMPTIALSLSSMAAGKTIKDAAFTATADDRFVFMLSMPAAIELVKELSEALKSLIPPKV